MPGLAEWLFEAGIGEDRAILIEHGQIVQAIIERPGLRAGTVADARLTTILVPGRRGVATTAAGQEVLVEPSGRLTEGAAVRLEIVREAIAEPGAVKRAKGRVTDNPPGTGPTLADRIGPHRILGSYDPDLFEDFGWSECLEQAMTGVVNYASGTLRIALTPAMTLIDVDGDDAVAGAEATARAIRRFGITGNIGIDLPTVAGRSERQAIVAAFDAVMLPPFERTALNGFGFLQIISPRARASLCEIVQYDRAGAAARALLRAAQRSAIVGRAEIVADGETIAAIERISGWHRAMSLRLGGDFSLRIDPSAQRYSGGFHRIG